MAPQVNPIMRVRIESMRTHLTTVVQQAKLLDDLLAESTDGYPVENVMDLLNDYEALEDACNQLKRRAFRLMHDRLTNLVSPEGDHLQSPLG